MVISHTYRYLFIEIPHAASTALSRELRTNYAGERILHKHATYHEFLRAARPEERGYFVFASIRNPLDEAVSLYFKYLGNHKGKYTDPSRHVRNGGSVANTNLRRFAFIQHTGADFAAYFRRFYRLPYTNLGAVSFDHCDYVIRFERLQEDFSEALRRIGAAQKRPLPEANKTSQKDRPYQDYYTPDIAAQARRVFGPYMRRWGYAFPPEWGEAPVSGLSQIEFRSVEAAKVFYWKYLSRHPLLRLVR